LWEQGEGFGEVAGGGVGVEADGVEAGVAEHVGDGDQVGAAADKGGGEGVPSDVSGDVLLLQVGVGGDGSDDAAGAANRQPAAAAVEQQRGAGVGAGPVGPFVEPGLQVGAQLGVDGQFADGGALASDP
jgi:hypothetical protein